MHKKHLAAGLPWPYGALTVLVLTDWLTVFIRLKTHSVPKKRPPFYLLNWPILIIFGVLYPEKIWHEHLADLSTSPVGCSHFTSGNPEVVFNSVIHRKLKKGGTRLHCKYTLISDVLFSFWVVVLQLTSCCSADSDRSHRIAVAASQRITLTHLMFPILPSRPGRFTEIASRITLRVFEYWRYHNTSFYYICFNISCNNTSLW